MGIMLSTILKTFRLLIRRRINMLTKTLNRMNGMLLAAAAINNKINKNQNINLFIEII